MKRLFQAFERAGKQLYLVGGGVRDHLMGTPLDALGDLDFATDASPDESLSILRSAGIPTHPVGKHFGTVGAILRRPGRSGPPIDCQITTFRAASVGEQPTTPKTGRAPSAFGRRLEDDLAHRDFTINSIAMRPEGGDGWSIVDPFEGRKDLERGRLRAVGSAAERLREDPLRILRVARFVAGLGFEVDDALREAATARAHTLLAVSRERWLAEMNKLLLGAHTTRALELLRETRALGIILPEVAAMHGFHETCAVHHKDLWRHTLGVVARTPATKVQRWTALLHDAGKVWTRQVDAQGEVRFFRHELHGEMLFEAVAARFRFDKRTASRVAALTRMHGLAPAYSAEWSDSAVRRFVRKAGEHLEDLMTFARADLTTASDARRRAALERVEALAARIAELSRSERLRPRLPSQLGRHLMTAFDLRPGPRVGQLIERLTEAVLDGRLPAEPTVAQCLALLRAEGMQSSP